MPLILVNFFILACVFVSLSTDWQMLLNNCYQKWVANIWSSMESQQVRKSGFSNLAEHSFLRPIFPSRNKKHQCVGFN